MTFMKKTLSIIIITSIILLSAIIPSSASSVYIDTRKLPAYNEEPKMLYEKIIDKKTEIIPCESRNSIFFLSSGFLYELKPDTNKVNKILEFGSYDAFSRKKCFADNKVYVVSEENNGQIRVFNLLTLSYESPIYTSVSNISAIGVDANGRVYAACYSLYNSAANPGKLYLINRSGKILSYVYIENEIYEFDAFDAESASFYTVGFKSMPFDIIHTGDVSENVPMTVLRKGKVTRNRIDYNENDFMVLACNYHSRAYRPVEMICNKYLAANVSEWKENVLIDKNATNLESTVFSANNQCSNCSGRIGSTSVYLNATDTIVVATGSNALVEYDIKTNENIHSLRFPYSICTVKEFKNKLFIIGLNDGCYYYNLVDWKVPTRITLNRSLVSINYNEVFQLTATSNTIFPQQYLWSSNNPNIAGVTSDGKLFGWREGNAIITCTLDSGIKANCSVTVTGANNADRILTERKIVQTLSDNTDKNNYDVYANTIGSYLNELKNGEYETVHADDIITVTRYDSTLSRVIENKTISMELPIFGGAFCGEKYNFLVFGQNNPDESNNIEVIRVVKYNKSWKRIGDVRIKGCNTLEPFCAGSLRMSEAQGNLYIYSCHTMYKYYDGNNHQANMTFVINEENNQIVQKYCGIYTLDYGYVSHSFNQFIDNDGENIYRVDHGDAFPRGISVTKCSVNGSITENQYTVPFGFRGLTGMNNTGSSVGGMVLTSSSVVIAGNSDVKTANKRNIMVISVNKNMKEHKTNWITDYTDNDDVAVQTPHLVKFGTDKLLLIWVETRNKNSNSVTKAVTIDPNGNKTSEIKEISADLSDCLPVLCSDNLIKWYVSDGKKTTFYSLDFQAVVNSNSDRFGDVNGNGKTDIGDVTVLQQYLADFIVFDIRQKKASDVNSDGKININDATFLQRYLARMSANTKR